ncbi:hypothetical protein JHK85_009632 [Glycine max]|nr:hypothetical protein JHK85_009632 [Glycine max]KAG5065644.1 hypothetical protein JHK86_009375 [Glycine max]
MEQLLELEPEEFGNYVLLANIYAELGKWEGVSDVRKLTRSKRIKKTPGCSLIEHVQESVLLREAIVVFGWGNLTPAIRTCGGHAWTFSSSIGSAFRFLGYLGLV